MARLYGYFGGGAWYYLLENTRIVCHRCNGLRFLSGTMAITPEDASI